MQKKTFCGCFGTMTRKVSYIFHEMMLYGTAANCHRKTMYCNIYTSFPNPILISNSKYKSDYCMYGTAPPHIPRNANIGSSLTSTFHVSKSSEIVFSIVNFIIVWLQVVTSPFDLPFCFVKPIWGHCKPLSLPFYVAETF